MTERAISLKAFWDACRKRDGCAACADTTTGRHHSDPRKKRQIAFRTARDKLIDGQMDAENVSKDDDPEMVGREHRHF